jgi:hypothetical protein
MRKFYWRSGSKANGGVDFNHLLVVGQLAERCWDSDFFWHKLNLNFYGQQKCSLKPLQKQL